MGTGSPQKKVDEYQEQGERSLERLSLQSKKPTLPQASFTAEQLWLGAEVVARLWNPCQEDKQSSIGCSQWREHEAAGSPFLGD